MKSFVNSLLVEVSMAENGVNRIRSFGFCPIDPCIVQFEQTKTIAHIKEEFNNGRTYFSYPRTTRSGIQSVQAKRRAKSANRIYIDTIHHKHGRAMGRYDEATFLPRVQEASKQMQSFVQTLNSISVELSAIANKFRTADQAR